MVFCQLDVSGRTEAEPAADRIAGQLLAHVAAWRPSSRRAIAYAGADEGRRHLEAAGFSVSSYRGGSLAGDRLLVLGPGAGTVLRGGAAELGRFLQAGGRIAGLGLGAADALVLPVPGLKLESGELLAPAVGAFPAASPFAGIGPADLHDRDPGRVLHHLAVLPHDERQLEGSVLRSDPVPGAVQGAFSPGCKGRLFFGLAGVAFFHPNTSSAIFIGKHRSGDARG